MKYLINLILLVSIPCFAQNENYIIKGKIKDAVSDYLFIRGENFIDSTLIKDEKFEFRGQLAQPKEISFFTKNTLGSEGFYLENSNFEIDLLVVPEIQTVIVTKIAGKSKTQQLKNDFISFYESSLGQKDFESKVYNKLDSLISTYPKNPVAGEMLAGAVEQGGILSALEADNLLNKLNLNFQREVHINSISNIIKGFNRFKIGSKLPAIILPNENDKMVNTTKSNAKLTFIEFCFVGCGPCLKAIPKLKDVYKEFNSKNVEFIFIAVQNNKTSWKNALVEIDMPWQNLICIDGNSNQTIQSLQINSYPSSFLIDENNKILGINLEPIQLRNKLKDLLAEKS